MYEMMAVLIVLSLLVLPVIGVLYLALRILTMVIDRLYFMLKRRSMKQSSRIKSNQR